MKTIKIFILFIFSVLLFACNGNDGKLSGNLVTNPKSAQNPSDMKPVIQFEKTEFDFGKILQGEVVSYTFHFTNEVRHMRGLIISTHFPYHTITILMVVPQRVVTP